MNYKHIIKPDMIEEYIRYHKKLYNEMNNINSDILLLDKIYELPIADLQLHSAWSLCALVLENTLQNLSIKLYRLLWDTDNDVFTITRYKNEILKKYLKDDHKTWFQLQLKESNINEASINSLKERIHNMRNNFLAHRNRDFFQRTTGTIEISFAELRELVLKLNKLYKIMSFEVSDAYTKNEYYHLDIRDGVEKAFSNSLDDCMLSLILTSDLVNNDYDLAKYDISKLSDENKLLLDKFKKKVLSLNFISD